MATAPLAQGSGPYILGINWTDSLRRGVSFTWRVQRQCSFNGTVAYGITTMPTSWDNRASSAEMGAGCNRNTHFQYENYNADRPGITFRCGLVCDSLGDMNDKTSSEEWRRVR